MMKCSSGVLVKMQAFSMTVGAGAIGEVAHGECPQDRLVVRTRGAVRIVRVDRLAQVVVAPELEAGHVMDREAVVAALLDVDQEDGKALRLEELRPRRLEPGERPAAPARASDARRGTSLPIHGPARDDEPIRLVGVAVRS